MSPWELPPWPTSLFNTIWTAGKAGKLSWIRVVEGQVAVYLRRGSLGEQWYGLGSENAGLENIAVVLEEEETL